jgi:hypothetical protein
MKDPKIKIRNPAHMKDVVEKFQEYVATYSDQPCYTNYSTNAFIDDMLYGIAIAIDKEFSFANGYSLFKEQLHKDYLSNRSVSKEEALAALENLDDFSRMNTSVNPIGPYEVLKQYIENT